MVAPANDLLHLVLQHVSGDSVSIYTFSPGVVPTPWRRALWAVRMPRAPHLQQRRRGIEPDPASRGVVPVQLRLQQHLAQHGLHRRAPYVAACAHRQRAALLQPPATPHVDTAAMLPRAAPGMQRVGDTGNPLRGCSGARSPGMAAGAAAGVQADPAAAGLVAAACRNPDPAALAAGTRGLTALRGSAAQHP